MLNRILHASQWCYKHNLKRISIFLDKCNQFVCSADIPGCANIASDVSFAHGGLGCIIHKKAIIGSSCIINAKVTIGNGYPNGGTPKLGKYVYVGTGSFVGGGISIANYVIIGANSVVTKDIIDSGVIVAGCPARVIRKMTENEFHELRNWNKSN